MINEDGEMFSNFSMMEINVENLKEMCYNNLELEEEYKYILMMDMEKEELANYSNSDPLIRKYEGDLVKINSDKEFVALLTAEEDARLLHNTELAMEYKKGIKEGIKEGFSQGISYNVPISVDTIRRRYPIKLTYQEGVKTLIVDTKIWVF